MEKELVFGSEEWLAELNDRVTFPQMFTIYLGIHNKTNENMLHAVKIQTKSVKPNNIKYGSVKPTLSMALSPYKWLVEGVYYIESAEEYLDKMRKLCTRWDVNFDD